MKKIYCLLLGLLITAPAFAQTPDKPQPQYTYASDSLVAKRSFLTSTVLKDGKRLSATEARSLLKPTPKAHPAYQWGKLLQPVGPVLIVSGLAVGYLGIKGEQRTGYISGIRTPTNYYPDDIAVTYTKRSVPKLLAGVGLVALGVYFIERSNELTAKSVRLFNAKPASIRTLSYRPHVDVGLTSSGSIGLEAHF